MLKGRQGHIKPPNFCEMIAVAHLNKMSPEGNCGARRLGILQEKGSCLPGVCNNDPTVLPDWVDIHLLKRAKKMMKKHFAAIMFGHYYGMFVITFFKSIRQTLTLTGKSSTVSRSFRRILGTATDLAEWYDGEIWNPSNDPGYKSIIKVRKIHKFVANQLNTLHGRVDGKDPLFISQYDMMLTQFALMGFLVLIPEKFGVCNDEDSVAILHFWRFVGYLLGMEEEYNLLSRPYPEVVSLCEDIAQFELKPAFEGMDDNVKLIAKEVIWSGRPYLPRPFQGFFRWESFWLMGIWRMGSDKDKEMPLTFKDRFAVHIMKMTLLLQQNDHIAYLSSSYVRRTIRNAYKNREKIMQRLEKKYGHIVRPDESNEV